MGNNSSRQIKEEKLKKEAMEKLNNTELDGRNIIVSEAKSRE